MRESWTYARLDDMKHRMEAAALIGLFATRLQRLSGG